MAEPIILASASTARARLLEAAGIEFSIEPAAIDETRTKREVLTAGHSAIACAQTLAAAKAGRVSDRHPEALVIGADQILVASDEWFDKPRNLAEARAQLLSLRGRTHVLATAACIVCAGVLFVLSNRPSSLTWLKSSAYSSLVSGLGPSGRNCDAVSSASGVTPGSAKLTIGGGGLPGLGSHTPGSGGGGMNIGVAQRPSFWRRLTIAWATRWPTMMPFVFASPSGIAFM